jgi:hypothetical protein
MINQSQGLATVSGKFYIAIRQNKCPRENDKRLQFIFTKWQIFSNESLWVFNVAPKLVLQ